MNKLQKIKEHPAFEQGLIEIQPVIGIIDQCRNYLWPTWPRPQADTSPVRDLQRMVA
jgi:hypothetical protein